LLKVRRTNDRNLSLHTGNPERVGYDNYQYLHTLVRAHDLLDDMPTVSKIVVESEEDFDVHGISEVSGYSVDYVQVKFRQDESAPWSFKDAEFWGWIRRSAARFRSDPNVRCTFATNHAVDPIFLRALRAVRVRDSKAVSRIDATALDQTLRVLSKLLGAECPSNTRDFLRSLYIDLTQHGSEGLERLLRDKIRNRLEQINLIRPSQEEVKRIVAAARGFLAGMFDGAELRAGLDPTISADRAAKWFTQTSAITTFTEGNAPPTFFHVPDRTAFFVGREFELAELTRLLKDSDDQPPKVYALVGTGGIGKTELALQHCHARRDNYAFIWWFTAASRSVLMEQFVALASSVGIPSDGIDADIIVAQVLNWLEISTARWLIVFDNADDPTSLNGLIPSRGTGCVLITSRYALWGERGFGCLELGVLQTDAATQLLKNRAGRSSDPDATMLADHLQGHALALQQAAAFVSRAKWSFGQYLTMLRERARDLLQIDLARSQPLTGLEKTVYTVWQSSVDRAASDARYARDVLRVLSVIAAEKIPRSIFSNSIEQFADADPLEIDKALASLASYSLINLTEYHISLHRLVQTAEIAHMEAIDSGLFFRTISIAATLLNRSFPTDPDDSERWAESTSLLPHAANLSDLVADNKLFIEDLAYLECHTAGYLNARGGRTDAKRILERAERHIQGGDVSIPIKALIRLTLARIERNLGDLHAAQQHAAFAMKIASKATNAPDVSITGHNILGRVLMDLGKIPEAEAEFRTSLDLVSRAQLRSTRHEVVALNHLGRALLRLGESSEAEQVLQRALSIDRAIHSGPHADTAWSLDNLAMARFSLGDVEQAEDYLRQALSIEADVHGPDHPRSAWSARNLATVLLAQNRKEEAYALLERSLDILEKSTPDSRIEMLATLTLLQQTATALENNQRADEIGVRLRDLTSQ
jgi:tetratricopeptide (TPR) repeat protein